jgi:hypothetical protein
MCYRLAEYWSRRTVIRFTVSHDRLRYVLTLFSASDGGNVAICDVRIDSLRFEVSHYIDDEK